MARVVSDLSNENRGTLIDLHHRSNIELRRQHALHQLITKEFAQNKINARRIVSLNVPQHQASRLAAIGSAFREIEDLDGSSDESGENDQYEESIFEEMECTRTDVLGGGIIDGGRQRTRSSTVASLQNVISLSKARDSVRGLVEYQDWIISNSGKERGDDEFLALAQTLQDTVEHESTSNNTRSEDISRKHQSSSRHVDVKASHYIERAESTRKDHALSSNGIALRSSIHRKNRRLMLFMALYFQIAESGQLDIREFYTVLEGQRQCLMDLMDYYSTHKVDLPLIRQKYDHDLVLSTHEEVSSCSC